MIIRRIVALVIAVLLSACATRPISNEAASMVSTTNILDTAYLHPAAETVEVTVKRDSGFGGSACSSRIFVDGKPIADIRESEKVVVYLSKTEHILGAWPNGVCGGGMSEVRADLRAGAPATFRVGYGSNGDFYINQTAF